MDVLVVEDHPLIQLILPAMVSKAFGQAVVHLADNLEEAFERASHSSHLDLVLLDLGLPGCNGIESLKRFREKYPEARIVIVSATDDRDAILASFKAGAVGYIPKTSKPDVIIAALKVIAAGGTYVPPEVLGSTAAGTTHSELSDRQFEVLQLMLTGLSNRNIAKRLGISQNTVKHHVGVIYEMLGSNSRAEAMAAAVCRGYKPAA